MRNARKFFKKVTPHQFEAYQENTPLPNVMPLQLLSEFMGHASIDTDGNQAENRTGTIEQLAQNVEAVEKQVQLMGVKMNRNHMY